MVESKKYNKFAKYKLLCSLEMYISLLSGLRRVLLLIILRSHKFYNYHFFETIRLIRTSSLNHGNFVLSILWDQLEVFSRNWKTLDDTAFHGYNG